MELKSLKALSIITLVFWFNTSRSQVCQSCTVNVATTNSSSYTITSGQTFCIDTSGVFTGTLVLNGGSICNNGIFNPVSFSVISGTITNNSIFILKNNLILGLSVGLVNLSPGVINITSNLTIIGGTFNNAGVSNIRNNIVFSSGTFNNSAIVNCNALSGANITAITDSGIINKN